MYILKYFKCTEYFVNETYKIKGKGMNENIYLEEIDIELLLKFVNIPNSF